MTMQQIPLLIEAQGPLTFPERKPGVQFRRSLPYVPGSAIYGALGRVLAETLDKKEFGELFRAIRCHNAYPAFPGDGAVRPMPLTAAHPKGVTDTYHDMLYRRVCWEQLQPAALIDLPTDDQGRPWEPAGRVFYTLNGHTLHTRSVSQRVLTRVGINRHRGTAESSFLYSPLVINEVMVEAGKGQKDTRHPTRFRGSVVVPDQWAAQVRNALASIYALGGRQTTGIGAVTMTAEDGQAASERRDALKQRVQQMSQRFGEMARVMAGLGATIKGWQPTTIFTVNLLSDALLTEQGWLPTSELSEAMLREATGITATRLRSFASTGIAGGWNVTWQRPKQTALSTDMGSVFVFAAETLGDDDYNQLVKLEQNGIGDRRAEGFGQVSICDAFHLRENHP